MAARSQESTIRREQFKVVDSEMSWVWGRPQGLVLGL